MFVLAPPFENTFYYAVPDSSKCFFRRMSAAVLNRNFQPLETRCSLRKSSMPSQTPRRMCPTFVAVGGMPLVSPGVMPSL